jgi:nitrate reductase assembly molybdenum cofactor insertion protein NarJ
MTRSNLYIKLSDGRKLQCVADSSSAPEQGYIVEELLIPLLTLNDAEKELALLKEHCRMDELRANATYRYLIDLQKKEILFYEENYFYKTDTFRKGKNLTHRYTNYHTKSEVYAKEEFKHYSNKGLVA